MNPIAHKNEPMVVIPSWLDCRKHYGFTVEMVSRDKAVWQLIIPWYLAMNAKQCS